MIDGRYTADEWSAVEATAVGIEPKILREVRQSLETAAWKYHDELSTRERMADAVRERNGWTEIEKLSKQLAQLLKERKHWSAPIWGANRELVEQDNTQRQKALKQLDFLGAVAEENILTYETYVNGRANPNRDKLHTEVFRIWTDLVGQKLQWSDGGPIVRFFRTALLPVLGKETPTSKSIRDIMKREIARRSGGSAKRRRPQAGFISSKSRALRVQTHPSR